MDTSVDLLRIEFIGDVQGSWLPITHPTGSFYLGPNRLPLGNYESTVLPLGNYESTVGSKSIGGMARIYTIIEELDNVVKDRIAVVKVNLGDDLGGSPLYSLSDTEPISDDSAGYGSALKYYSMWASAGGSNIIDRIHVPGDNDFIGYVDVFHNYADDLKNIGVSVLAANAGFLTSDCPINHLYFQKYRTVTVFPNSTKIGIWGMTVPGLNRESEVPLQCQMRSTSELANEIMEFIDSHDRVIFGVHMDVGDTLEFASELSYFLSPAQSDKIIGILAAHYEIISCGQNGYPRLDENPLYTNIDPNLEHDLGIIKCTDLNDMNLNPMLLETVGHDSITLVPKDDGTYAMFPGWPMIASGVKVYNVTPQGWSFGHVNIIYNNGELIVEEPELITLNTSVDVHPDGIDLQRHDLNVLTLASIEKVSTVNETMYRDRCRTGWSGCPLGYIYAMAGFGAGSYWAAPQLLQMNGELKASLDDDIAIGSIFSGRNISKSMRKGFLRWVDLYEIFPYEHNLTTAYVPGANLIKNILHGAFGIGGIQMFGMRITKGANTDMERIQAAFRTEALLNYVSSKEFLCSVDLEYLKDIIITTNTESPPVIQTEDDKDSSMYVVSLEEDAKIEKHRRRLQEATTEGDVTTTTDAIDDSTHAIPTAIPTSPPKTAPETGCHAVPEGSLGFEINICLSKLYRMFRTISMDIAPHEHYPPNPYLNCECWVPIEEDQEYILVSSNYIFDRHDYYCLEPTSRFTYSGTFNLQGPSKNDGGSTGMVWDFANTFGNIMRSLEDAQVVTVEETPVQRENSMSFVQFTTKLVNSLLLL